MIYRSNLFAPDYSAAFPHLHVRPMSHSFGHSVPSDWADKPADDPFFGVYKQCGMLTHDEAAIAYNVARKHPGLWLDIGSHTGWSTVHLGSTVVGIDPMYEFPEFRARAVENIQRAKTSAMLLSATSRAFFEDESLNRKGIKFSGIMIDGDHTDGEPQRDARNARNNLKNGGVILFHDFIGRPVREAVQYLIESGFHCRVYTTPHMMAVCWQGDEFVPPIHRPDPNLAALAQKMPDFDFARCA
jgi:hypothetical protein